MDTNALQAGVAKVAERRRKAEIDGRMPLGSKLVGGEGDVTIELSEDKSGADGWAWILDHHPAVSAETHEVDETVPVEVGSWEMGYTDADKEAQSRWLYRYKAKVRLRRPGVRLTKPKVDELSRLVRKRKPKSVPDVGNGRWLHVCLADLQLGNGDNGGTPATMDRIGTVLDEIGHIVKNQPYAGVSLIDMGDLIENTSCFYTDQASSVDLNLTEQLDLGLEVMLAAVDSVAGWVPNVITGAVPSNHGEPRTAKGVTTHNRATDNYDLAIANSLAQVLAANVERYGHVSVWKPFTEGGDPYILAIDYDGVQIAWTHGHQIPQGKNRIKNIEDWWQSHHWSDGARHGRDAKEATVADADILVCGHGHHFLMSQATGRLAVQCPAGDNGSEWFTTATGRRSSAGVLLFETDLGWPMLANNYRILSGGHAA